MSKPVIEIGKGEAVTWLNDSFVPRWRLWIIHKLVDFKFVDNRLAGVSQTYHNDAVEAEYISPILNVNEKVLLPKEGETVFMNVPGWGHVEGKPAYRVVDVDEATNTYSLEKIEDSE